MKSVSEILGSTQPEDPSPQNHGPGGSLRIGYALVAILLAVVYLLSSWNPAESEASSFQLPAGFLLFWLAGGGITLALLTLAAKKDS